MSTSSIMVILRLPQSSDSFFKPSASPSKGPVRNNEVGSHLLLHIYPPFQREERE